MKTFPKFTRGPWRAVSYEKAIPETLSSSLFFTKPGVQTFWQIRESDKNAPNFARVFELGLVPLEEAQANANLIASAPEMYEAIELAISGIENVTNEDFKARVVSRLEEVLKKARGES